MSWLVKYLVKVLQHIITEWNNENQTGNILYIRPPNEFLMDSSKFLPEVIFMIFVSIYQFFNCTCTSLILWILKLYGNIYARFSNMYFYLSFEKMRKWVNEWMNKSVWFNLTLFYKRGQLSTFQGRSMQMKSYVWWEGTNSLSFACIEGLSNLQLRLNYI